MDRKKSILNVSVSLFFKIVLLFSSLFTRRILIQYIGNEVNGLNSLYLSIIGFLSVAELGVGSAITFSMYRPIVENDNAKVAALYDLYQKIYLVIGGVIFTGGIAVSPFLQYFAKDISSTDINLEMTFFLMLLSVVLTYLFSAKTSLINAYKNNYITTTISSVGLLLQQILQIIVTIISKSFVLYLVCRILSVLFQWVVTDIVSRKYYKTLVGHKCTLDKESKRDLTKNIKAMFMHTIGNVLVNTADSLIISAFIGVVVLGKYSNYTTIMSSMVGVLTLFFSPLTSIVGHMYVEEGKDVTRKYYSFFHSFNFVLGTVFFLGYYAIIDDLIFLCFGSGLELSKVISAVITVNYFIQFMRQSPMLFRNATGTFYNDRWKPLLEGLFNIIFSIAFVKLFPEEYNVVGVIVATILTNLLICHVIEPYVLHKYVFEISPQKYYINNYSKILSFVLVLLLLDKVMIKAETIWIQLTVNGCIAVVFGCIVAMAEILINKNFRFYVTKIISGMVSKLGLRRKVRYKNER